MTTPQRPAFTLRIDGAIQNIRLDFPPHGSSPELVALRTEIAIAQIHQAIRLNYGHQPPVAEKDPLSTATGTLDVLWQFAECSPVSTATAPQNGSDDAAPSPNDAPATPSPISHEENPFAPQEADLAPPPPVANLGQSSYLDPISQDCGCIVCQPQDPLPPVDQHDGVLWFPDLVPNEEDVRPQAAAQLLAVAADHYRRYKHTDEQGTKWIGPNNNGRWPTQMTVSGKQIRVSFKALALLDAGARPIRMGRNGSLPRTGSCTSHSEPSLCIEIPCLAGPGWSLAGTDDNLVDLAKGAVEYLRNKKGQWYREEDSDA